MNVSIRGYFKFSPIKTACVKIPDSAVSESLIRHEAGQDVFFAKSSTRDAWNAVIGKCAELGWYKNGGWLPNGKSSARCAVKDKGDILGVCAMFMTYAYAGPAMQAGFPRSWLYCDKVFEQAILNDFFPPDEQLKMAVKYSICGSVITMKSPPSQKWLYEFCRKTHDPYRFAINKFGHSLTDTEIAELSTRCPKLTNYIKTMLIKKS